jgi:hypothetical protein
MVHWWVLVHFSVGQIFGKSGYLPWISSQISKIISYKYYYA